jgi:predicted aspartyl protease/regulator of sirC expression with transglutaminase-like and TPR domain
MAAYLPNALAAFLALFLAGTAAAEPCHLQRYASIDLTGPEAGVPIISGSVNGKPAEFTVDTGGAWSMLPEGLAAGLPTRRLPSNVQFTDAADERIGTAISVHELGFGPVKLTDMQFLKAEWPTIGANILSHFDVELDPVERKLALFKHKPCDGSAAYWAHSDLAVLPFELEGLNEIAIEVTLDGEKMRALIDTGAEMSELDDREARNTFGIKPGAPGTEASVDAMALSGHTIGEYRHQFGMLEIGDIQITRPWLRIGDHGHNFWNRGEGPPLVLGMSTLAPFHLYVAYQERKIYVTTAQGDLAAGRHPAATSRGGDTLAQVNLRELMETADNAMKAGDVARARAAYDRAVAIAPDDPYALQARAQFRDAQHDTAGSKADYDRLATMALPSAPDYVTRSAVYRRAGQLERALADAEQAVRRWPDFAAGFSNRCRVQAAMGKIEPALADCNAALALAPKSRAALEDRGFVEIKARHLESAIADYDAAIALDPNSAGAFYGRSLARRQQGDMAGADADLIAARAIDGDIEKRFGK